VSIRLRLAAVFTLATALLVALGAYVFIVQLRGRLESSLDQSLQARAATIAADLGADPAPRLSNGAGGYAQIYSATGGLLRSSRALTGDRLLSVAQVRTAAAGSLHTDRVLNLHGHQEAGSEPMRIYGTQTGSHGRVVAVAASRDLVDEAVQQSRNQLAVLGVLVVLLAAPGSWLLARAALRPVDRMRAQVARLQATDVHDGVAVPRTRDELARLGRTFNGLLSRLHAALERERAFVADAGHELRSPLTVLKGEFELAQRPGRSRTELAETVSVAAEETDRLIRLTENLLLLAREDVPAAPGAIELADLAHYAITAVTATAAARGVRITLQDEAVGTVAGDAGRFRQAIDNLLTNAIRYSPPDGTVTIRLARDGSDALLQVIDQGPGFPPEFLPRAFERFARADDARTRGSGGSGLGLAIVAAIMQVHNGTATAANRPGGGAVLTLRWPQHAAGAGTVGDVPVGDVPVGEAPVAARERTVRPAG
jgi:heavy metal sensor kinase